MSNEPTSEPAKDVWSLDKMKEKLLDLPFLMTSESKTVYDADKEIGIIQENITRIEQNTMKLIEEATELVPADNKQTEEQRASLVAEGKTVVMKKAKKYSNDTSRKIETARRVSENLQHQGFRTALVHHQDARRSADDRYKEIRLLHAGLRSAVEIERIKNDQRRDKEHEFADYKERVKQVLIQELMDEEELKVNGETVSWNHAVITISKRLDL